jgi:hypothetical protein
MEWTLTLPLKGKVRLHEGSIQTRLGIVLEVKLAQTEESGEQWTSPRTRLGTEEGEPTKSDQAEERLE